ncbi:hypothetical protein [Salinirubrum litoreum]|uniref:Uncharacterized protein n=1 Tax=Salinirubrum litoreum TaxID=1126234 RepID=A0ABD5R8I7_9EURY|nr:hypothetical protein [Salinirubrum litoreum]
MDEVFWDGIAYVRYTLYALAGILLLVNPSPDARTVAVAFLVVGVLLAAFSMGANRYDEKMV